MRWFLAGLTVFWLGLIFFIHLDDKELENRHGSAALQEGRVQVIFWHAMGGPLGTVMDDLVGRYNKSQNRYVIKSISMGSYDTLAKKLLASLVAKSGPDISQNFETLTKKFLKYRKIVCLDELIASEAEDIRADIIPVLRENNTYAGKMWSFPFNKSVPVLYYNKEIFRAAGLDPNRPPQTLDELASYARHLTKFMNQAEGQPHRYGYSTNKGNVWMFLCRVLQYGGRLVDSSGKKCYFNEAPAVRAMEFIQNMVKEKIAVEAMGFDHQNDFKAQNVAMIDQSIVSKVHMESGIKFEFGVAPLPGAATNAVILSGSNINIFDNGDPEKIKGAWDFVKWFTSTEIGAEWSIRTTYLPVRKSSLQVPLLKEALAKDPNLSAPYVQLDYTYFEPRLSVWFEIRDLMADYLERSTIEMGSPKGYLDQMNKDIDGLLKHSSD